MVYGRVTVLGLFILFFVGIWSSDQPAVRQEYAARHRGQIYVIGSGRLRDPSSSTNEPAKVKPAQQVALVKQTQAKSSSPIPAGAIPGDLTTGRYRVVNNAGVTTTVDVTGEWLNRENIPTGLPAREFYIHQTATECWYWIRLRPAHVRTAGR